MAKTLKKKADSDATPSKPLIQEKYQDAFFIGMLALSVLIFFWSAIFGGGFNASDNIASVSFVNYIEQAKQQGSFPQWVPHIFGGMPGYSALLVTGDRWYDMTITLFFGFAKFIGNIFNNDTARMAFYYALYAAGIYLLMRAKKHERVVAFFSAAAAAYSTWVVTWIMIGHNTKPIVFAMYPFIFLFMEKLREKFSILYSVLLIIAVHIMLEAGHLQMIYYGIISFAIYLLFELVTRLVTKNEPLKVLRSGLILAAAAGIAFLMSADRYLSTLEYTPYSTRGSAPITQTKAQHQDASGGNDYNYATMWSYSPEEMMTFFVPSYYGFGIRDYKEGKTSTYWGQKESEDSPPYMGIIVIGLGLLGLIAYRKDAFVQALFAIMIFGILISFGKNFSLIYDILFYHAPNFNKFRAPSMSLAMMHFSVPILAGYGISALIRWRKNISISDKKLLIGWISAAGIFLVAGIIFSAGFKESYFSSVDTSRFTKMLYEEYGKNEQVMSYLNEFKKFNWSSATSDWLINGVLAIATVFLGYFFVNRKIKKGFFISALIFILFFDLWRVDYRRMEVSKKTLEKEVFAQYENVYKPLQKERDTSVFRIFDMLAPSQNIPAYYLMENVNGYHSAKLRVYQDLLDNANDDRYAGSTAYLYNPFLWNLMNVKYIVAPDRQKQQPMVYPNNDAMPRAFFVKRVEQKSQMEILKHLKTGDFQPAELAYVEQPLAQNIDTSISKSSVKINDYKNESIKLSVNAEGNNLLFLSEIYYPPCWHAYLDGKEIPIIKTNFAFRSVIVPKGQHELEFKYFSQKYETGKTWSLIANILCLSGLAAGIFFEINRRNREKKERQPAE